MCGIGGIFRSEPNLRVDPRADLLREALRHRGPDDEGAWQSADGLATLVHARLSILDPRPAGRQPMERQDQCLSFNGEIYNFRVLRKELEQAGESFRTHTDSEVLLALFRHHGVACLHSLRGMFSFALWDERSHSGVLVRDRFGIKPLYYGWSKNGDLLFASEIRALLATGSFARKIDPAGLESYLVSGSVAEPLTLIAGISCLEAGTFLEWKNGHAQVHRYTEVGFPDRFADEGHVGLVRAALRDSIQHHLVSDVPVAMLLSGGLDSGALLSLARDTGLHPLTTLTLGVEDGRINEAGAARIRAKAGGSRHHELLLTRELAEDWMLAFWEAVDQPTIDGFNTYCIAKLASAHGFRVVLSGVGGDELFGGYPSFAQVPQLCRWGKALGPLRQQGARLVRRIKSGKARRLAHFLTGPPTPGRAYDAVRSVFSPEEARLLACEISGSCLASASLPDGLPADGEGASKERVSRFELTRYLRNQLLRDADVFGMAHGVEVRVPFIDHVLFDTLQRIPPKVRFAPGKRLLRQAVPEAQPLEKGKRGFTLPFASWLDRFPVEWPAVPPFLASLVPMDTWPRKWSLLVLTLWLRRHLDWDGA